MCDLGKCLSTNWRNDLAIFVWTFSRYGGLNQMMFLGLFLFHKPEILVLIVAGRCLIMEGGWLDFALMYSGYQNLRFILRP